MGWLRQFVVTVCVALLNATAQVLLGLLTAFLTSPVSFASALARLVLVGLVLYVTAGILLQWVLWVVKVVLVIGVALGLLLFLASLLRKRPGLDLGRWWDD